MPFEMLVGLNVTDADKYGAYRRAMTPILETYGGKFGYDFQVSEVFKTQTKNPINRVFTLTFPNEGQKDQFFADAQYAEAKETHFDEAVSATTLIANYEKSAS